jgi:hypothetical protein
VSGGGWWAATLAARSARCWGHSPAQMPDATSISSRAGLVQSTQRLAVLPSMSTRTARSSTSRHRSGERHAVVTRGIHGSGHVLEHPGGVARRLRTQQVSLGVVAWIVVGLVVASQNDFLDDLGSLERILSAILAVLVWPLVLLDVHFGI